MTLPATDVMPAKAAPAEQESYVTALIGGQLFGLPINRVQDVFNLGALTRIPLAPPDVLGLLNLRGRVVTALDLRPRLGLAPAVARPGMMAIGIAAACGSYALVADRVGEIATVDPMALEANPVHLDPSWAALSRGVHRLEGDLLIVLDVDEMIGISPNRPNTPKAPEATP